MDNTVRWKRELQLMIQLVENNVRDLIIIVCKKNKIKKKITKIYLFAQFPNKIRNHPVVFTKIRQHFLPLIIGLVENINKQKNITASVCLTVFLHLT